MNNQNFHTDHFSCSNCKQSLTGSRYILKDENPHCIKCYEELFAHTCEECKRKIGTDSKVSVLFINFQAIEIAQIGWFSFIEDPLKVLTVLLDPEIHETNLSFHNSSHYLNQLT
jgi:hypothetical protein